MELARLLMSLYIDFAHVSSQSSILSSNLSAIVRVTGMLPCPYSDGRPRGSAPRDMSRWSGRKLQWEGKNTLGEESPRVARQGVSAITYSKLFSAHLPLAWQLPQWPNCRHMPLSTLVVQLPWTLRGCLHSPVDGPVPETAAHPTRRTKTGLFVRISVRSSGSRERVGGRIGSLPFGEQQLSVDDMSQSG